MNLLTKKNILIFLVLLVIFTIFYIESVNSEWCRLNQICKNIHWSDLFAKIIPIALISLSVTLLPFSVITYFFSSYVFGIWKKFAIFTAPIMVMATVIIANLPNGGGLPGQFHLSALILPPLYLIYFLISLIVIFLALWKSSKNP